MYKKNAYNSKDEVHYASSLSFSIPPSLQSLVYCLWLLVSLSLNFQILTSNFSLSNFSLLDGLTGLEGLSRFGMSQAEPSSNRLHRLKPRPCRTKLLSRFKLVQLIGLGLNRAVVDPQVVEMVEHNGVREAQNRG